MQEQSWTCSKPVKKKLFLICNSSVSNCLTVLKMKIHEIVLASQKVGTVMSGREADTWISLGLTS